MFDPKAEVPSLELCKRLKELGYPQEGSGFYWVVNTPVGLSKRKPVYLVLANYDGETLDPIAFWYWGNYFEKIENWDSKFEDEIIKAPTCQELFDILPYSIEIEDEIYYLHITVSEICYEIGDHQIGHFFFDYLIEGLTEEIIWLAENGYVKFERKEV